MTASVLAWIILCFMANMHNEEDFNAFAMVCLAAVVAKSKSLS